MNNQLSQVKALMKAHEIDEARQQLDQYLKANPEDAQGWYAASFLQPTQPARLAAIQRAAKLKPTQTDIQQRLVKLQADKPRTVRLARLPLLMFSMMTAVTIFAGALMLFSPRTTNSSDILPTLVVLQTLTSTPVSANVVAVLQQSSTPAEPTSEPIVVTETRLNLRPTREAEASPIEPAAGSLTAPLTVVSEEPAMAFTSVAIDPATTPKPTDLIPVTVPPTSPPSISPPNAADQGVPLNVGVQVTSGELRVVDATQNAANLIRNLGGSVSSPPANHTWMLLELLLICHNSAPCTFDLSNLEIVNPLGEAYAYSPQLNLTPIFATFNENNQLWGYVGFIVPTHESELSLIYTQTNQSYTFALQ